MDIEVHTRRVDLSDDTKAAARRKAERLGRYLASAEKASVTFGNGQPGHLPDPVTCEMVIEAHGRVVRVKAAGQRPEAALDLAARKAELRLTKLKTRLVDRSRPKHANGKRPPAPGVAAGAATARAAAGAAASGDDTAGEDEGEGEDEQVMAP